MKKLPNGSRSGAQTPSIKGYAGPTRWPIWLLLITLAAAMGCRVGPDYAVPDPLVSTNWKHSHPADQLSDESIGGPWWSTFRDPALDKLIAQAIVANPGLQSAYSRIMEARAKRGVVTRERLPQMDLDGSYSYKKVSGNSSPYALLSQDGYDLFSTGFDAIWELDFWGKQARLLEAADAEIDVADGDYNHAMVILLGDVAATYVELRMYEERIQVAFDNVKIQERTLRLARDRRRAGLAKPLDAAQAESSLHATKASIPHLEIGAQKAENRLCVLIGEVPGNLRESIGHGPIPTGPQELALGTPASLIRRRPDILSAERRVVAESTRIGVEFAEIYPQLSILGTISVDSTEIRSLFTGPSISHTVGPSLTWNILNYDRIRNRVHAQEARFSQAASRYQSTVLSAIGEVEDALVSCVQERARTESLSRAAAAAQESIRLAEIYYEQGLASFQTVLDSQRALTTLRDQLIVSRAKVTLNRIALFKALGGGWESVHTCGPVTSIEYDSLGLNEHIETANAANTFRW